MIFHSLLRILTSDHVYLNIIPLCGRIKILISQELVGLVVSRCAEFVALVRVRGAMYVHVVSHTLQF